MNPSQNDAQKKFLLKRVFIFLIICVLIFILNFSKNQIVSSKLVTKDNQNQNRNQSVNSNKTNGSNVPYNSTNSENLPKKNDAKIIKVSHKKEISDQFYDENTLWSNKFFERFKLQPKYYNIYFFETNSNRIHFTLRQLCAIESAAKNNPNAKIRIYSVSAKLNQMFLEKYPNIEFNQLDIDHFLKDTILENWYAKMKNVILSGPYSVVHLSDILRLVVLWKYGGYYADLDTITVKSVDSLIDYPGVGYINENHDSLNNAIMNFPQKHPFLVMALNDIMLTYNPQIWGHNGPLLMIRTMK